MVNWSRDEKLTALGLLVAVLSLAGVPEVRDFVGLRSIWPPVGPTPAEQSPATGQPPAVSSALLSGPTGAPTPDAGSQAPAPVVDRKESVSSRISAILKGDGHPGDGAGGSGESQDPPAEGDCHVSFEVSPLDASIYLEGKFMGTAADLAAGIWVGGGEHKLAIVRPGYLPRELSLNIAAGEARTVSVDLQHQDTSSQR